MMGVPLKYLKVDQTIKAGKNEKTVPVKTDITVLTLAGISDGTAPNNFRTCALVKALWSPKKRPVAAITGMIGMKIPDNIAMNLCNLVLLELSSFSVVSTSSFP